MYITIYKEKLVDALTKITTFCVGSMDTITFEIEPNKVNLLSSREEGTLSVNVECFSIIMSNSEVKSVKSMLGSKKLLKIIKSFDTGQLVELAFSDEGLEVIKNNSTFNFDYCEGQVILEPEGDVVCSYHVPSNELHKMIGKTKSCMAKKDVRYYLNSMAFVLEGGILSVVGTNGSTLACNKCKVDVPYYGEGNIAIVPEKIVENLYKNIQKDSSVSVLVYETTAKISEGNVTWSIELIQARYPNYERVIPTSYKHKIEVSKEDLTKIVKDSELAAEKKDYTIIFNINNTSILVENIHKTYKSTVKCQPVCHNIVCDKIGIDSRYLEKAINSFDGHTLELCITDLNTLLISEGNNTQVICLVRLSPEVD